MNNYFISADFKNLIDVDKITRISEAPAISGLTQLSYNIYFSGDMIACYPSEAEKIFTAIGKRFE